MHAWYLLYPISSALVDYGVPRAFFFYTPSYRGVGTWTCFFTIFSLGAKSTEIVMVFIGWYGFWLRWLELGSFYDYTIYTVSLRIVSGILGKKRKLTFLFLYFLDCSCTWLNQNYLTSWSRWWRKSVKIHVYTLFFFHAVSSIGLSSFAKKCKL